MNKLVVRASNFVCIDKLLLTTCYISLCSILLSVQKPFPDTLRAMLLQVYGLALDFT